LEGWARPATWGRRCSSSGLHAAWSCGIRDPKLAAILRLAHTAKKTRLPSGTKDVRVREGLSPEKHRHSSAAVPLRSGDSACVARSPLSMPANP